MNWPKSVMECIEQAAREGRVEERGVVVGVQSLPTAVQPWPAPPPDCSETHFQAQVVKFAEFHGWLAYHTHDSRRSAEGFPDLVLVREFVIFAELKSATGKLTPAQKEWHARLVKAGAVAHVWYPENWNDIVTLLGATRGQSLEVARRQGAAGVEDRGADAAPVQKPKRPRRR